MTEAPQNMPAARHEPSDIGESFIWAAIAAMAAMLVGCALLVTALYPHADRDQALKAPLPAYPAPRLQADPAADMRRFRAAQLSRLNGSGSSNEPGGLVHIPISQAMKIIAAQGIPGWPAEAMSAAAKDSK